MSWRFIQLISVLSLVVINNSCIESDYTRLVKSEIGKEVRYDSLLLGIGFNDTRKEFYQRCFELNKEKLVSQGPSNASVQYDYVDSVRHDPRRSVRLLFYPKFDKGNLLNHMDLEFSYLGWAPWNKSYQSDVLLPVVKETIMEWYGGNDLITAEINGQEVPVKIDGNRRMIIYIKDTQSVIVRIQDLTHPKFKHSFQ